MFRFVALIGLSFILKVSTGCDDGWTHHAHTCYHFSHDLETFGYAKEICKDWEGQLVEIDSMEENHFLADHARLVNTSYFIGLTDLDHHGNWVWYTSQTTPNFTEWGPGQPDNHHGNQFCAAMFTDRVWDDVSCGQPRHYICEIVDKNNGIIG